MIPVLTHIPHKHYTHMRVPTGSVIGRENITKKFKKKKKKKITTSHTWKQTEGTKFCVCAVVKCCLHSFDKT